MASSEYISQAINGYLRLSSSGAGPGSVGLTIARKVPMASTYLDSRSSPSKSWSRVNTSHQDPGHPRMPNKSSGCTPIQEFRGANDESHDEMYDRQDHSARQSGKVFVALYMRSRYLILRTTSLGRRDEIVKHRLGQKGRYAELCCYPSYVVCEGQSFAAFLLRTNYRVTRLNRGPGRIPLLRSAYASLKRSDSQGEPPQNVNGKNHGRYRLVMAWW